jgi:predicted nucleic acid-binding protein
MNQESPLDTSNVDELMGREHVEPLPPDSRHETWRHWLETIDKDITSVYANRAAWKEIMGIVAEHPAMPPSHFFALMAQNYATTQAVAVRRQDDKGQSVVSLSRLLSDIADHPETLSRQRYVALYPKGMQWVGDKEFDKFAGGDGDLVDADAVRADLDLLHSNSEAIRTYVNKRIAHHEESPPPIFVTPTFSDLDEAIDTLGSLLSRYALLLTGVSRSVIAPVPQYDWLAPFRIPWLVEGDGNVDDFDSPSVSGASEPG